MGRIPRVFPALLLGLTLLAPAAAQARPTFRITGGQDGDIARTPWMAALIERGETPANGQFCGGAVIAPQAVVTAAHCVEDTSAGDIDVLTGRTSLGGGGGQRVQVSAIRVHPGYSTRTSHDDVAVLLLSTPTSATPLALAGPGDAGLAAAGRPVLIAGWGTTSTDGPSSDRLLEGTQIVRANARCEKSWAELFDERTQFCAVGAGGGRPDTCPGDSGGPPVGTRAGGLPRPGGLVSFGGGGRGGGRAPRRGTRGPALSPPGAPPGGAPGPPPP